MAAKSKVGVSGGKRLIIGRPKRTRQGNGQHSKPSHGRKLRRGQGK